MRVFSKITDDLTSLIENDLFNRSVDIMSNIAPLFAGGFGIYLVIVFWGYQKSGLDDAISDLAKRIAAWLIIIALAFNAGNYNNLAKAVYSAPDEVASWLTGGSLDSNFVETQLDNVDRAVSEINSMGERVGTLDFGDALTLWSAKIIVFVIGYLSVLFIWGFYMITKFSLALVLVLGPIFIGAMLFPASRQYGMNWISQCLNYIVTVSLYMGISLIQLYYVEATFSEFKAPTEMSSGILGIGSQEVVKVDVGAVLSLIGNLIIITIIFIPIVFSIPSIASALTGGAGVDGHGRIMERLASAPYRGLKRSLSGAGRWMQNRRGNKVSKGE